MVRMSSPDITYFLVVRSQAISETESIAEIIIRITPKLYNGQIDFNTIQENIDKYRKEENTVLERINTRSGRKSIADAIKEISELNDKENAIKYLQHYYQVIAVKNRQDYINSLWWWNWLFTLKPRNEQENKNFIDRDIKESRDFINDNDDIANTLFGTYASAYATIMFVEKILLENYGHIFTLTTPAAIAIVSIALFNLLLDKYLFDLFWQKSTLDDRENFKLMMLIIIAIVCCPLEIYVIPVALLLYTAGYFMNYMLQKGKLTEAINKIFNTPDEDGVPRLFEGYAVAHNIKFNNYHYALLFGGVFGLSLMYGVAMAALAAMWIYPAIASFASLAVGLGFAISPLGLLVCMPLVAYGIFYAIFIAQAWATLIGLYANLKQDPDHANLSFGGFMWVVFQRLYERYTQGIAKYFNEISKEINTWKHKTVLIILGTVAWGTLTLTWKLIQVSFSVLTFYGMYYMLDQACQVISEFIKHDEASAVLTPVSYVAQTPVMLQQADSVATPETIQSHNDEGLPKYSEARILFYRIFNALRVALVPIGGEQMSSSTDRLVVASTAGASFVLVESAIKNARKQLTKTGNETKAFNP